LLVDHLGMDDHPRTATWVDRVAERPQA
jgi:hypothetical protein